MKTSTLLVASLLLGAAPALAKDHPKSDDAAQSQYLTLRTPRQDITAKVTPTDISSPQFQLGMDSNSMRGRAYGRTVDLSLNQEKGEVTGSFGQSPVNLKVTENANTLEAKGFFAGQPSNLKISPDTLTGTVGRCSYQLKQQDALYQGSRSCGRGVENPVSVSIPPLIADSSARAVAALSVLLSK
ncbi:hypothetical protein DRW03_20830 [Corallococcus sp. H22C18031201]|uniref:hypothetical protein n=1 Tax=Citreicoccus inhibens TaxID=2849499 RepID=UPI000E754703|nr:hypothetical protein [Citreicoccus inhibens]MBU8895781.1 hypothetical protein [Citreicoccus inhibens]RJS20197.1 hypothetical protein DRW03_20830 [Corallococcus sp. H22C18031201]